MFLSYPSSVFGIYSKRAIILMIKGMYEALEPLFSGLYHHQLEIILYPGIILFILWFLHVHEDSPIITEQGRRLSLCGKSSSVGQPLANESATVQFGLSGDSLGSRQKLPSQSGLSETPVAQENLDSTPSQVSNTSQANLRNILHKVSFLDLRLNDISNRSLQDSIWATPEKRSTVSDKTPTQKDYGQREVKGARTRHEHISMQDAFCSNKAERAGREKLKAFERNNMGTSPWLGGALRAPKQGPAFRLHGRRSYPRLRHSVLDWWAGVQEQTTGAALLTEPETPPEFDEHSDCSVCEVIHPWDSWSTAVHSLHFANAQDNTTRMRRTFTDFDAVSKTRAPQANP